MQVAEAAGEAELYRFNVTDLSGMVYRLAAPTEAARQAWLSALRQAILAGSPSHQNSTGGAAAHSPHSGQLLTLSFLLISIRVNHPGLRLIQELGTKQDTKFPDMLRECFQRRFGHWGLKVAYNHLRS